MLLYTLLLTLCSIHNSLTESKLVCYNDNFIIIHVYIIDPAEHPEAQFGCPLPTSQTGDRECSQPGWEDKCPPGSDRSCGDLNRCCQTKCGKTECLPVCLL